MPKFTVKSPLNHDNRRHEPGAIVELTDEAAAPLLEIDVVEPVADKKAKDGK